MIKITPKISAAIGATKDRIYIRRKKKKKINDTPAFYNKLVEKSGKSSNNLKNMFINWTLAYKDNLRYQNMIEDIQNKFKGK